jgi:serine/threonine protein kinase
MCVQDVWKAILTESGRMDRHIDVLDISVGARDFLRALLQRDPSKRVSATQALQLPVRSLLRSSCSSHAFQPLACRQLRAPLHPPLHLASCACRTPSHLCKRTSAAHLARLWPRYGLHATSLPRAATVQPCQVPQQPCRALAKLAQALPRRLRE